MIYSFSPIPIINLLLLYRKQCIIKTSAVRYDNISAGKSLVYSAQIINITPGHAKVLTIIVPKNTADSTNL